MLVIASITGAVVATRRTPPRTDLTYWVFADAHAQQYRMSIDGQPSLVEQYRQQFGRSINVNLINTRALDTRLLSLMMSGATGDKVPDIVQLEIGSVGKYFRFPPEKVGLLPLDEFIDRDGLRDQILPNRLASWSRGGVAFGIPHDVHPVGITYRRDLFDQAGVDLAACKTWDAFHDACLKYQEYWEQHGEPWRVAVEMSPANADIIQRMLLQRGVNTVDSDLKVHIAEPKVIDTLVRYAEMVAGDRKIGAPASPGGLNWLADIRRGALGAMITPDWRITFIRNNVDGELDGKLALMPLPKFEESDAPTSTWGGTMIGISRHARDPAASWEAIKFFHFSEQGVRSRVLNTDILGPDRKNWEDPKWHKPDRMFGGQRIGELLIELAKQVPSYHATPFTGTANTMLIEALDEQVRLVESGASREERTVAARQRLIAADEYVRRVIDFAAID